MLDKSHKRNLGNWNEEGPPNGPLKNKKEYTRRVKSDSTAEPSGVVYQILKPAVVREPWAFAMAPRTIIISCQLLVHGA